jgi:tetratricopeptide (TPR) repeat protein
MKPAPEERIVLWVRCAPGRDFNESSSPHWVDKTVTRAHISGAEVLVTLNNSALITFDGVELEDAVEFARHSVEEASGPEASASIHIGLALGDIETLGELEQPSFRGSALDRAQLLSHRARSGEIVFDEVAEQRGEELFLFGREVLAERVRGYVLDPVYWNKRQCRQALKRLKPSPIPKSAWPVFERLRAIGMSRGQQRIALYCDAPASALDLVERLLTTLNPPLRLGISRNAGALRPLGSLALALGHLWPDPNDLQHAELTPGDRAILRAVIDGDGVPGADVVTALSSLLGNHISAEGRPCVVLEELQEIDPATLGVIAEVFMAPELDALLLITLPTTGSVPAQLVATGALHQLILPTLPAEDRVAIAEAVLSLDTGAEIAQRVAMLGGDSALSVVEAVRTLVSSGDLVRRGEHFEWRLGPRLGATAVPVEALITERVAGLLPGAYRVLEAISVSPRSATREFIEQVAAHDGLSAEEFAVGLGPLMAEGFVDDALSLGLADAAVRGALRNIMPPARVAELHRFVADLLRAALRAPGFGSGELAYHLAEGGQPEEAAQALVDAAHAAVDAGFQRVALRLLATAVDWDGSAQIRKAASDLARTVGSHHSMAPMRSAPPAPDEDYEELKSEDLEQPTDMAQAAMRSALHAFTTRDYEGVERWLDAAVAAGGGRAAAQRVLAMVHLARGEREDAMRTLQRSSAPDPPAEVRARDTLSWALLRLSGGDAQLAVRDALAALAQNRQLGDARGETAALRVLALGYRMLDRAADADSIDAAAVVEIAPDAAISHGA